MGAELRHRKRDGDETSLHRAEERDDVVEALRSHNRCPITNGAAQQQLISDDPRSLVDLRPRQAFGKPRRVYLVVDERLSNVIRLLPRPLREHSGNGRLNHRHHDSLSVRRSAPGPTTTLSSHTALTTGRSRFHTLEQHIQHTARRVGRTIDVVHRIFLWQKLFGEVLSPRRDCRVVPQHRRR